MSQQHQPAPVKNQPPADHGMKAMTDKIVEMAKDMINGLIKKFQSAFGELKNHPQQGQNVPEERLSYLNSPPQHIMSQEKAQQIAMASSQSAGGRV